MPSPLALIASSSDISGGTSCLHAGAGRLELSYQGRVGHGSHRLGVRIAAEQLHELIRDARRHGAARRTCPDGPALLLRRSSPAGGFAFTLVPVAGVGAISALLAEDELDALAG